MTPDAVDHDAALRRVWEQHRAEATDRLDAVEAAVARLRGGALDEETRHRAEHEAHTLAGAVGTFGFTRASEQARAIEEALRGSEVLDPGAALRLDELARAIRGELDEQPAHAPAAVWAEGDEPVRRVLAIDDDGALLDRLAAEGASRSVQVQTVVDIDAARVALAAARFDLVLLDLSFRGDQAAALALLSELAAATPPIPVLVLTASEAFTHRVEVARRGGRGFLSKTLTATQVIDAAAQLLAREHAEDVRVVAVDDDPSVLEALRVLLEPEGVALRTVSDPRRLWDALEETVPDLLILDVEMPAVSGIELCRTVRNDQRWARLPVMFLTGRRDRATVQAVFAAGADDYVGKPIVAEELTMRIRNRIERIRLYRSLADTDPLTGIANRRKSSEAIEQLLRLAARHGQPLALAELDLDRFKQLNDEHGHAAGDAVLRRLGELLRRAFRGDDVVARWGGEEFVVAMYGMSREDGVQRLTETLDVLRRDRFGAEGIEPKVTFSGGVAEFPADGDDLRALYRAADRALYAAKTAGRDRVLAADDAARRRHTSV